MSINQKWVLGKGVVLDFGGATPTVGTGSSLWTVEGCASICDANGALLLYTDGRTVWDGSHAVKYQGLNGHPSSTQSGIIVPDPASPTSYYIFTAAEYSTSSSAYEFLHVDTSNWNFTTPQSTPGSSLSPLTATEKLTAVQHVNCQDYWVLMVWKSSNFGSGTIRAIQVTSTGLMPPIDSPVSSSITDKIHDIGYLRVSPDGKRLAMANIGDPTHSPTVLLFDFDTATGIASNAKPIAPPTSITYGNPSVRGAYGVEFSPNSQLLYYSVYDDFGWSQTASGQKSYLLQVDLSQSTLVSTQIYQHTSPANPISFSPSELANIPTGSNISPMEYTASRFALGALQLAMDNRIYVALDGEQRIGAILSPDTLGTSCNFQPNYVSITAPYDLCYLGFPNLLQNPCERKKGCSEITAGLNEWLTKTCSDKKNVLAPCTDVSHKGCGCTSSTPHVEHSCKSVEFPKIEPCISVSWGDSECECFETDDHEVLCITVCNCYSNVTFSNFNISYVYVYTDTGATVPELPDGSLSVEAFPRGPFCFGDIGPCKDNKPTCVSRQVVVVTRGAKPGNYQLKIGGICFDVVHHYDSEACFKMTLCLDAQKKH